MNICLKPKKLPKNVGRSSKSRNKMPIKSSIKGKEEASKPDKATNAMRRTIE
jgi:hypothetical protein